MGANRERNYFTLNFQTMHFLRYLLVCPWPLPVWILPQSIFIPAIVTLPLGGWTASERILPRTLLIIYPWLSDWAKVHPKAKPKAQNEQSHKHSDTTQLSPKLQHRPSRDGISHVVYSKTDKQKCLEWDNTPPYMWLFKTQIQNRGNFGQLLVHITRFSMYSLSRGNVGQCASKLQTATCSERMHYHGDPHVTERRLKPLGDHW